MVILEIPHVHSKWMDHEIQSDKRKTREKKVENVNEKKTEKMLFDFINGRKKAHCNKMPNEKCLCTQFSSSNEDIIAKHATDFRLPLCFRQ